LVVVVTGLLSVELYRFGGRYEELHPQRESLFHRLVNRHTLFDVVFMRDSDGRLRLLRLRVLLSIAAWVASFVLLMLSSAL
jgi:hypothetical protein